MRGRGGGAVMLISSVRGPQCHNLKTLATCYTTIAKIKQH